MGAEVTVFSTSPSKEEEATKKLGAHHFVLSTNEKAVKVKSILFDISIGTEEYYGCFD